MTERKSSEESACSWSMFATMFEMLDEYEASSGRQNGIFLSESQSAGQW